MKLLDLISKVPETALHPHSEQLRERARSFIPPCIPDDIREFLWDYSELEIFPQANGSSLTMNTWSIGPSFWSDSNTISKLFGPPPDEESWRQSYYDRFFILGQNQNDGGTFIGFSADPRAFGIIFEFHLEGSGPPMGIPKTANSFLEWLDKIFSYGPYSQDVDFAAPDFYLGPAIPEDPYYRRFSQ